MNIKIFLLLSLVSIVHLYNLEDTWALRTSEIPTLQALKTPIYFQFSRSLSGDGKSIVGYLTITACNILSYNYNVTDSQIFMYFVSKGRTTRTCLNGEITYLRSKLDEVFYFYIMYNTLLLMPANNNSPIKLDIVQSSSLPTLNGLWAIIDPKSGNKINNGSVVINGTQMSFCQGSQLINYNLTSNVKISLNKAKNTSTCSDNINIFANSSRFVKVNRVDNPQTVTFFDDKVKPVLKLIFQGVFLANKFVVTQPNSNATIVKINATVSNSSLPKSIPNATVISKNITNGAVASQGSSSSNSNSTKANSTSTQTSNSTASSNSTRSNNTSPNNSNTATTTNKTSPPKNISTTPNTTTTTTTTTATSPVATPTSSQPVLVSQAGQGFGVWYPSTSLLPGSLTVATLSKYQLIINAARLMLSGGCNTIFSTYTFSSGSFKPNNIISTSNSCPNNQDSILKDIIFNPSNTFYFSGSGNSAKMTINSPQNTPLLLLTQIAPS